MRCILVLLSALALCVSAHAATLVVPDDFSDLQSAIDAAAPGDVILIRGGVHGPVVVDKPLYLVGAEGNRPLLLPPEPFMASGNTQDPALSLAGPGSGVVTLSNLEFGGQTDGTFFGAGGPAVAGDGFAELRVLHCDVRAPAWIMPTGTGFGTAAIEVGVPYVLIEDSLVEGQAGTSDFAPFLAPAAGRGIDAQGATVVVLDSSVRGGDGDGATIFGLDCTTDCDVYEGDAADAIRAGTVYHANSSIAGGAGQDLFCELGHYLCTTDDGQAFDAGTVTEFDNLLQGDGPLSIGGTTQLTYIANGTSAFLVLSLVPAPPLSLGPKGVLFMNPDFLLVLPVPAFGFNSLNLAVTTDLQLLGIPVAFQLFVPGAGLSRPVFATHVDS